MKIPDIPDYIATETFNAEKYESTRLKNRLKRKKKGRKTHRKKKK